MTLSPLWRAPPSEGAAGRGTVRSLLRRGKCLSSWLFCPLAAGSLCSDVLKRGAQWIVGDSHEGRSFSDQLIGSGCSRPVSPARCIHLAVIDGGL